MSLELRQIAKINQIPWKQHYTNKSRARLADNGKSAGENQPRNQIFPIWFSNFPIKFSVNARTPFGSSVDRTIKKGVLVFQFFLKFKSPPDRPSTLSCRLYYCRRFRSGRRTKTDEHQKTPRQDSAQIDQRESLLNKAKFVDFRFGTKSAKFQNPVDFYKKKSSFWIRPPVFSVRNFVDFCPVLTKNFDCIFSVYLFSQL